MKKKKKIKREKKGKNTELHVLNANIIKGNQVNKVKDLITENFEKKQGKKNDNNIPNNLINNGNNKNKTILEIQDFELNALKYSKVLKKDERTFSQYYISLIKNNHLIIFSFLPIKDYNSRIIKIFLFFFFVTIHLTVNALFFNDDTMHKIYIDEGIYNFIYQIPQIIYSSLISGAINTIIKYLSLSQDNIIELKQLSKKTNLEEKHTKLLMVLRIKFILFFIFTPIILVFIWFYISCFCGIYKNTQIHLIKDSVISFVISLITPFGKYLLPTMIRIQALKNKKEYLFKVSSLLQNI